MYGSRLLVWLIVMGGVSLGGVMWAGPMPSDRSRGQDTGGPGVEFEVQFIDDSRMKLRILDEKLELQTKHGVLRIAVSEIRRIDFASRLPAEVAEAIAAAVLRLGHPDSQTRDQATAELRNYRERAYSALVDATRSNDPEVVRRAEQLLRTLKQTVPATLLAPRDLDVVHTEDSKIAGKLSATSLKVKTFQFGEQVLKLSDLRSAGPVGMVRGQDPAQAAPANLMTYQGQFGKELTFSVTGAIVGTVWGTDVYTLDSSLATACVHSGKVALGQTANVTVRIVQGPQNFVGSTRNGVTSSSYGPFPGGAFEFVE